MIILTKFFLFVSLHCSTFHLKFCKMQKWSYFCPANWRHNDIAHQNMLSVWTDLSGNFIQIASKKLHCISWIGRLYKQNCAMFLIGKNRNTPHFFVLKTESTKVNSISWIEIKSVYQKMPVVNHSRIFALAQCTAPYIPQVLVLLPVLPRYQTDGGVRENLCLIRSETQSISS